VADPIRDHTDRGKDPKLGQGGGDRTEELKALDRLLAQWSRFVESRALSLFDGDA
jgi:hypothetical protein